MATDHTFSALANSTRRQLLELLREGPRTPGDLARYFELSRPAVSEHLAVLRRTPLVHDTQVGRERHYELADGAFREINRWLEPFERYWRQRLRALGEVLDDEAP